MAKSLTQIRGMAALEIAGMLVLLIVLMIAGMTFSELLSKRLTVHATLDKYFTAEAVVPYTLDSSAALQLNTADLDNYVASVVNGMEQELVNAQGSSQPLTSAHYLIEAAYALLDVNGSTGVAGSFIPSAYPHYFPAQHQSRGALNGSGFEELGQALQKAQSEGVFTTPKSDYDSLSGSYYGQVVLVAGRIVLDPQFGWIDSFLKDVLHLSNTVKFSAVRVVPLRAHIK